MYFVYLLQCQDNSIYTGITTDIARRFFEHKNKKGGAYTASHPVQKILHTEEYPTRSQALVREAEIKKLTRNKKLALVKKHKNMKEIERNIASALIFAKDGKLLQGIKDPKKGGVYSDCWHIPGGGINNDKSKEEALKMEITEETGIDISKYKIVLVDDAQTGKSNKTLNTDENVVCKMKFFVYKIEINDKNSN